MHYIQICGILPVFVLQKHLLFYFLRIFSAVFLLFSLFWLEIFPTFIIYKKRESWRVPRLPSHVRISLSFSLEQASFLAPVH